MKSILKLAAAAALAAVISTLTACGNSAASKTEQIAEELDGHIVKSKVTSADSTANSFVSEVNTYIADCYTAGGGAWESGAMEISVTDGEWTISGYDIGANKPNNMPKELLDVLKTDFSSLKNAFIKVYINENGKAYAAIFTEAVGIAASEYPPIEAFDKRKWTWDGKTAGVSPSGKIVGTCPKVTLSKQ